MNSGNSSCFFCKSECQVDRIPEKDVNYYKCANCGIYILDEYSSFYPPDININDESVKSKLAYVLNQRRLKGMGGIAIGDKTDVEADICGFPQISVNDLLEEYPKESE